jgi:hypothetical protein
MSQRLNAQDMQLLYPSQSQERAKWFSIKEDRGTRRVRFLYNDLNDVYFDVIHEVKVNNRTTQIQCLNARGEDVNNCPLCSKGHYQKVVLYIPVLDVDTNEVLIWTRSKTWLQQIQGLMARNNPLSGTVFEIMRIGTKGDMKTQYMPQPISMNDGKTVQQILQELNTQLPDPASYMKIMDFNEMMQYATNLDSISGNVPVARSGYGAQPQYGAPATQGYGAQSYSQPTAQSYGPAQTQTGYPTAPAYNTQPVYGQPAQQYAPTTPMTPPANVPVQAPAANRNIGSEPVRRVPQNMPNPNVGMAGIVDDSDLPF